MTLSSTARNRLALVALCLVAAMFGLEISSIPVILPTLEKTLHADFEAMQWIMNAYTIACTTVLMAAGTLADRYGRKRVLAISLLLFGLTSLACGLAPSAPLLIGARFLQGLSGGTMLICQIAILSHQFQEGRERSRAFAIWGVVFGVGLGFGPIVGGAIAALWRWEWVFLVHAPLAAIAWLLAAASIGESRDPEAKRLDLAGIVTLSLAVLGLTGYITQGPGLGFASATGLALLAASAASFAAFVAIERSRAHPMFDFSVFRIRAFSGAILGSVGMNFSFWPFMIYLPIYFQAGLGYDAVQAGTALLAYTLPTLLAPPLGERLAARFRAGAVIPTGLFAIGAGFLLMRWGSGVAEASWLTLLPGCLLAGLGLGVINTPVTNTTTGSVPASRAGMASGHRHERAAHHAGDQHRADGLPAARGHRGRAARRAAGTGALAARARRADRGRPPRDAAPGVPGARRARSLGRDRPRRAAAGLRRGDALRCARRVGARGTERAGLPRRGQAAHGRLRLAPLS